MIEYETTAELVEHLFTLTADASVFVEVGAQRAEFSRRAAEQYPDAHVYALEANPHNWQAYAPTMPERVQYLNAAGCETDGRIDFHVMATVGTAHLNQTAGNNSLRERTADGISYEVMPVKGWRIDSLLAANGLTGEPCAMWWDVEGAQDRVIAGAPLALASCLALMVEVEEHAYWQGQPLADDVDRLLTDSGMVAIARDREFPLQHNRIYVPRAKT